MQTLWENFSTDALAWITTSGPAVLTILIGAALAWWLSTFLLRKAIKRVVDRKDDLSQLEREQRTKTLQRVSTATVKVLIVVVTLMVLLSEFGLDIGPLLAAAGVAGVALGFGAQYLIQDIISGFFILIEDQYSMGDVICLNGTCGTVEEVTLRVTKLRDLDGVVHYIQNGHVNVASNMSQRFSRVNLNVGVAYESDIDEVKEVINRVGQELADDPEWGEHVIEPPRFFRVDDLGDSAIYLKVLGDVKPGQQWAVTGEMRRRLKKAFDEAHIEIPFPQQVMRHVQEDNSSE
ncbi:MAG: mechanosensitive ion channel family protein [Candidatus Paceibacterota bacterium]